jgi:lysophospholipase L1-like esterase
MHNDNDIKKFPVRRWLWGGIALYLLALHATVLVALMKTDLVARSIAKASSAIWPIQPAQPEPSQDPEVVLAAILERELFVYPLNTQLAFKKMFPVDPVFFVGDSTVFGLDVASITPSGVNLGLSGDNTAGALYRIKFYSKQLPSFSKARAVVIAIGVNNLGNGLRTDSTLPGHVELMLRSLPEVGHIVLNGILPVDERINREFEGYNNRILAINNELSRICNATPQCSFLNIGMQLKAEDGNLSTKYHRDNDAVHLSTAAYAIWERELRLALAVPAKQAHKEVRAQDQIQEQTNAEPRGNQVTTPTQ